MPNVLTEKLGPLPTWGWMSIGTILVVGYYLVKKSKGGSSTSSQAAEQALAAEEAAAANVAAATQPNYDYTGNGMNRGGGSHSWKQTGTGTIMPPGGPPPTGTGTTGTTGTGTQPPGGGPVPPHPSPGQKVHQYRPPTSVTSKVSGSTVSLSWGLTGQPSPAPSSYTIAIYNSQGQLKSQQTVSVPDTTAGRGTFTTSGLAKGTYHANIWANGGAVAPQHSTTNFTIR